MLVKEEANKQEKKNKELKERIEFGKGIIKKVEQKLDKKARGIKEQENKEIDIYNHLLVKEEADKQEKKNRKLKERIEFSNEIIKKTEQKLKYDLTSILETFNKKIIQTNKSYPKTDIVPIDFLKLYDNEENTFQRVDNFIQKVVLLPETSNKFINNLRSNFLNAKSRFEILEKRKESLYAANSFLKRKIEDVNLNYKNDTLAEEIKEIIQNVSKNFRNEIKTKSQENKNMQSDLISKKNYELRMPNKITDQTTIDKHFLNKVIDENVENHLTEITDKVYSEIDYRLKNERYRMGIF